MPVAGREEKLFLSGTEIRVPDSEEPKGMQTWAGVCCLDGGGEGEDVNRRAAYRHAGKWGTGHTASGWARKFGPARNQDEITSPPGMVGDLLPVRSGLSYRESWFRGVRLAGGGSEAVGSCCSGSEFKAANNGGSQVASIKWFWNP